MQPRSVDSANIVNTNICQWVRESSFDNASTLCSVHRAMFALCSKQIAQHRDSE